MQDHQHTTWHLTARHSEEKMVHIYHSLCQVTIIDHSVFNSIMPNMSAVVDHLVLRFPKSRRQERIKTLKEHIAENARRRAETAALLAHYERMLQKKSK